jgi:hypothetical protein
MKTVLITIETSTTPLDVAYYAPDDGPIHGSVLLLHGNTMTFYTGDGVRAGDGLARQTSRLSFAALSKNQETARS